MTKYLMKIISICSFIVLIPIIIVGVALSAVGSTMFKVDTFVSGAKDGVEYSINIGEVNSEKTATNSASFVNGTSVNVNFVSDGYVFQGWSLGDLATSNKESFIEGTEGNPSYTFDISGNTQLTAVVKIKSYTLSFQGVYDDDEKTEFTIPAEAFVYGDSLLDIVQPKNDANVLLGWRIVEGEDQTVYTHATFAESGKEYILEPVWSVREKVAFYSYEDKTEIKSGYYTKDEIKNFTFPELTDKDIAAAIGSGYEFDGWVTETGAELSEAEIQEKDFNAKDVIKIYLKKKATAYTMNVQFRDGASDKVVVEYKRDQGYNLTNLEGKRLYYTFTGLKVDGTVYNKAGDDFVAEGGDTKLSDVITTPGNVLSNVVALWTCDYNTVNVRYSTIVGNVGKIVYRNDGTAIAKDIDNMAYGYQTLTLNGDSAVNNLEELVYDTVVESGEPFYIETDEGNKEVVFKSILVYYDGGNHSVEFNVAYANPLNFTNAIYNVLEYTPNYDFTKTALSLAFVFEVK